MIKSIIFDKNKRLTTFLNPFSYLLFRRDFDKLKYFNVKIDGGMLVIILNLFRIKVTRESFDMTSLGPIVFNEAINENKSVYFIGTKPHVIDSAIKNIQEEFPALNISGFRDGYMSPLERDMVIKEIINKKTDYVVCGMGTPLQEQFLIDLQKFGWNGKGYTCGGFLHQTANCINYYPKWINSLGLRAFYRMYDEPQLIKRYFTNYPQAICIIVFDLIKDKFFRRK